MFVFIILAIFTDTLAFRIPVVRIFTVLASRKLDKSIPYLGFVEYFI